MRGTHNSCSSAALLLQRIRLVISSEKSKVSPAFFKLNSSQNLFVVRQLTLFRFFYFEVEKNIAKNFLNTGGDCLIILLGSLVVLIIRLRHKTDISPGQRHLACIIILDTPASLREQSLKKNRKKVPLN